MSDNGAVFQEIIGIEFDTQKFTQSLDELASIYEQKLQEMSAKGIDLNTAGVAELHTQLGEITGTVKSLGDVFVETFSNMTNSVTQEIEKQHELQKAIRETDEQAGKLRKSSGESFGNGIFSDFKTGLRGSSDVSISGMLGQVARFQLLWGAVGLAMNALMAPIHAIVDGIKEGFEYVSQLEQKAYELTGVLDANVRFSNDLKENFQLASKAAPEVVKALQDVAAATGLKPDNLFRAFSALAESGGTGTVHNLEELVRLTELFALAMRAAGASAETSRLLISQIPQAMSGNISSTSKWLEVLHMGPKEWNQMVKAGLEHHDLLQRLQAAMQPYLDATSQAALNEQELSDKVEMLKKRLEATFVAPYQETYKKFLTDVIDLMGGIDDKAASINKRMAEATNANMSSKHPWMMFLLAAAGIGGPEGGVSFPSETNAFAQGPQFDAELSVYAEDLMKRSVKAKHPPGDGKPNNDALNALEQDYSLRLRKIKDDTRTELSDIADLERSHTISVETATQQRTQAYRREREEIDKLIAAIQKQLLTVGGKDAARTRFGKSLGAEVGAAANEETRGDNKADAQLAAEQRATDESYLRGALQRAKTQAEFEIAEAKRSGANHVQVVDMETAADQKMYALESQLLAKLMDEAGKNEKAKQDVQNQIDALQQTRTNRTIQRSHEMATAIIADLTKQMDEESAVAMGGIHHIEQRIEQEKRAGKSANDLKQEQKSLSEEYIKLLNKQLAQLQGIIDLAVAMGVEGKAVDELRKKYEQLNAEKDKAVTNSTTNDPWQNPIKDNGSQTSRDLKDFVDLWHEGVHDFGDGVKLINTGFKVFKDAVGALMSAWKQGKEQGGVLGGIGGVLGEAGSMASMIPGGEVIGGVMQIAGSVLGMIGGIFTSAAKHIAEDIKKEFAKTVQELHDGTINLNTAIQQIEQERADAIARLSGKKGGKDQLNQLLPQLDSELASLRQQQQSVFDNFEQTLNQLQLQNGVLATTLKTWQDINKQVKDYLNAGGDAVKAQQFVSLQLQQMQKDAQSQVNQGNQTAIQDALQLNDLLTSRINLQKQFAATLFGLQTKDSLERRGSNAVTAGLETQKQIDDFNKQMSAINDQIGLTQQKVSLESKIFDINKSVAALQKDSNALQIASLNEQLDKIKAFAQIYQGIYKDANGNYSMSAALSAALGAGPSSIPVTININGTGGVNPADVADQLSAELQRRGRYGLGADLVRQY